MVTYRLIRKLRKHIKVADHAVEQYHARIRRDASVEDVRHKLTNAYLRGGSLSVSARAHMNLLFKYGDDAKYYRYGDLVVVVHEVGQRYEECEKTILTCYRYKESKFDPAAVA